MDLFISFVFMCVYIGVIVSDYMAMQQCPDPPKYFVGIDTFGGRYKNFTVLTQTTNALYFTMAFFTRLLRLETVQLYLDYFFTTVCWMMSWVTVIFFWVLFAMDREFIYPAVLEEFIPVHSLLNHAWHTLPLVIVVLECMLIKHSYPPPTIVILLVFSVGASYSIWLVYLYNRLGVWVYPFMASFNLISFGVFVVFSTILGGLFYCIGRILAELFGRNRVPKSKTL